MKLSSIPNPSHLKAGIAWNWHDLNENGLWGNDALLRVFDIAPLANLHFRSGLTHACFFHIVSGDRIQAFHHGSGESVVCNPGDFGQANGTKLMLTNLNHQQVARVIVMEYQQEQRTDLSLTKQSLDELPYEPRPAGIRLKSPYKYTSLPKGAGYEYVEIDGIARRHRHHQSSAIWLVLSGEGKVGMDIGGKKQVAPIVAGSYGSFPAGSWHGFWGNKMVIISAQIPDIETDYEFQENVEYDYHPG